MLPIALLETLADGRDHSRALLRESLALEVDEIENQVNALKEVGLTIVSIADDVLRLADPISWLETESIKSRLVPSTAGLIESLERSLELESTNRYLLGRRPPETGMVRIAIAEYQTAGRGRRGRSWSMPPGAGIALSASWRFEQMPEYFSALSLAVGAVARRAITEIAGIDIGLKWPNDLIVDSGKLGGILVELAQLPNGACHVVAGIGINVKVPHAYLAAVSDFGHGARDLSRMAPEWPIDREALVVRLIEHFIELFSGFADTGFDPYRAEWLAAHVLDGEAVELKSGSGTAYGTVCGIDSDGALLIQDETGARRSVISGDVTIRALNDAGD